VGTRIATVVLLCVAAFLGLLSLGQASGDSGGGSPDAAVVPLDRKAGDPEGAVELKSGAALPRRRARRATQSPAAAPSPSPTPAAPAPSPGPAAAPAPAPAPAPTPKPKPGGGGQTFYDAG
jgi:hypothetical protein